MILFLCTLKDGATWAHRGYMLPWMYSSIGFNHFRRRAPYFEEGPQKGKGKGTVFSVPVLVGFEYSSAHSVNLYGELSGLFNSNNIKGEKELKLDGNLDVTVYRHSVVPVLGSGVSENFGEL